MTAWLESDFLKLNIDTMTVSVLGTNRKIISVMFCISLALNNLP